MYHVGNVSEVHSTIRSGLIPGRQSLKRGRQSVFFTIVNSMEEENCVEETSCDLTRAKDCAIQKYLESSSEYSISVQFEARSRERIAVLPNKIACNRTLRRTTSCLRRESGLHEDEG